MRLHLYFILILTLNYSFSQENFNFQTEFKLKPNGEYAVEHFSFNFLLDKGKLIQKDLDLGHEKNYFIKFYESTYSKDGSKFVVAYVTDFNKHFSEGNDKDSVYAFTLIYDEKMGNILMFKIQSLNTKFEHFYLTKLGKEIRELEKN